MKETTEKNEFFLQVAVQILLQGHYRKKVIRDRIRRKKEKAKAERMEV
jgi:hypothetical protein